MNSIPGFIQQLGTNPWLNTLSFTVTLLSAVLAVFFYFKAKRAKKPRYAKRSINIVEDLVSRFESLEILYEGKKIENLTVTKVAFWNDGNETLQSNDIASVEPITIEVQSGHKILKAQKIYEKNVANKIDLKESSSESHLLIEFEYLDKSEGAIFQLFHTGISNEDVIVRGIIKGAGKVKEWRPASFDHFWGPPIISRRRIFWVILFWLVPILGTPFALYFDWLSVEREGLIRKIIIFGIPALIYWIIGLFLLLRSMPKGFDAFIKDDFSNKA